MSHYFLVWLIQPSNPLKQRTFYRWQGTTEGETDIGVGHTLGVTKTSDWKYVLDLSQEIGRGEGGLFDSFRAIQC